MKGTKISFQGWGLVGFSALAIGAIVTVIWLVHGVDELGMRMVIRATARTSCILFLGAFVASALHKIWSNAYTAWLLKNRRYLGLSMAVSHTYHAIAWTGLWVVTSGNSPQFSPLAILGYVFLIAMTVTSFRRPAAVLGQRIWQILHSTGMYYFWLAFTAEFSLKLPQSILIYSPFFILLVLALIVRFIAAIKHRKSSHV
jgi:methionine sulfoxide reductase heme-binding subunit